MYVAFFRRRYIRDRVEYLSFVIILRRFAFVKSFLDDLSSESYELFETLFLSVGLYRSLNADSKIYKRQVANL